MRPAANIILALALSGCSWFSRKADTAPALHTVQEVAKPPVQAASTAPTAELGLWPAIPDLKVVVAEVKASSPEAVKQAVEIVESSADKASVRDIKEAALYEVVRYAAWAMGLGFLAFLFGGFIPIPGIRTAGAWTVGLGAAIATLAPWLNGLLGNERVQLAGYAAFGILALAFSVGGAWWFLDKVRDAANKE